MAKQNAKADEPKTADQYFNDFLKSSGFTPDTDEGQEDLSQYEEEQTTSFPPYWKAGLGKGFVAKIVDLDARDPDFLRYVLEASGPVDCFNGPTDNAVAVKVQKGELFTTGVYRGAALHKYMGLEDPITLVCVGTREVKGRPNDMWVFKILTSKRDHATMAERTAIEAQNNKTGALSDVVKHAFDLAHTAKDAKVAVKAALNAPAARS